MCHLPPGQPIAKFTTEYITSLFLSLWMLLVFLCFVVPQNRPNQRPFLPLKHKDLFVQAGFFLLAFFFLATSYTAYLRLALGGPPIMSSLHCRMKTDATMLSSSQVRSYSSKSCIGTDLETVVAVFIFPSLGLFESQFLSLDALLSVSP